MFRKKWGLESLIYELLKEFVQGIVNKIEMIFIFVTIPTDSLKVKFYSSDPELVLLRLKKITLFRASNDFMEV